MNFIFHLIILKTIAYKTLHVLIIITADEKKFRIYKIK